MHFISISLFFFYQVIMITCSGMIEVVISSPKTVLISTTVCTTIRCNAVDENARKVKLIGGNHLRFRNAPYPGEAPRYYDLHLSIFTTVGEEIGTVWVSPNTDIEWQNGALSTSAGFNVTYRYRNMCDNKYYGNRCERFCDENVEEHTVCMLSGERKCMDGWTGDKCMTPICAGDCSRNGKCVAPNKCSCNSGYSGSKCEECTPKAGCLHGGCKNNVSFTCACRPGYGGDLCDLDLEYCQRNRPCQNGGLCTNSGKGSFTCQCPEGFVGNRCEIPIESVKCKKESTEGMCMNGGTCVSLDDVHMKCHCPAGYFGKHCEFGAGPCSSIDCKNGGVCAVAFRGIPQCKCATCYRGSRCEIFDADCLVSKMNASLTRNTVSVPPNDNTVSNTMIIIVLTFIVLALLATCFLGFMYCKMRRNLEEAKLHENHKNNLMREVTTSRRNSLTHKVCVLDAELSYQDATISHQRVPSPPPAYYPPMVVPPSQYKTLPTEDPKRSQKLTPIDV